MSIKKFLKILICLKCKSNLHLLKSKLICFNCKQEYKIVSGIPQLLKLGKGLDVKISKKKWEQIYKQEKIHNALDLQAISQLKFLSKYEKLFNKGIYLDLGCGISKTAPALAKKGVNIIGLDISFEAVLKSSKIFSQNKLNGLFIQADFLRIPLKDNSVEFVYWGLALEYVEDTVAAVSEVFRILKPGGTLLAAFPIISLPNLTYQQFRGDIPKVPVLGTLLKFIHLKILKGKLLRYGFGQTFSSSYIEDIFQNSGFQKTQVGFFDTYYPLEFLPEILRSTVQKLLKHRLFWPFAFIEAKK